MPRVILNPEDYGPGDAFRTLHMRVRACETALLPSLIDNSGVGIVIQENGNGGIAIDDNGSGGVNITAGAGGITLQTTSGSLLVNQGATSGTHHLYVEVGAGGNAGNVYLRNLGTGMVITSGGTQVGNSVSDTVGFWGHTPVVQQSRSGVTTVTGVLNLMQNMGLVGP